MIVFKNIYSKEFEDYILAQFLELTLKPFKDVLGQKLIQNKHSYLLERIRSGQITYSNGEFKGNFGKEAFKELSEFAEYKKGSKKFVGTPPPNILLDITQIELDNERRHQDLLRKVDQIIAELDNIKIDEDKLFSFFDPNRFKKILDKEILSLGIRPILNEWEIKNIREQYIENARLSIKNFNQKETIRLREFVQKSALGLQKNNLVNIVEAAFDVSNKRARQLAKDEMNMFLSKYSEIRYLEAGIDSYTWWTMGDSRVRPDHQALNGRVFRFDSPPVSNLKTGARNNPGMDYGCRCIARPKV